MAVGRRNPAEGLLHHSDRGSQYTSLAYQVVLAQLQIQVSMSGKGGGSRYRHDGELLQFTQDRMRESTELSELF